jgi:hypothetical protein
VKIEAICAYPPATEVAGFWANCVYLKVHLRGLPLIGKRQSAKGDFVLL